MEGWTMTLVERLLEVADLTPPICNKDEPEGIEHLGRKVTVYCNPFQEVKELCREAAAALQSVAQPGRIPVTERLPESKWEIYDDDVCGTVYKCPECGDEFVLNVGTPDDNNFRHCPNCGKRLVMPKEVNEE